MKKFKLDDVQMFRLQESARHTSTVLSQIKQRRLSGEALQCMQNLEDANNLIQAAIITGAQHRP